MKSVLFLLASISPDATNIDWAPAPAPYCLVLITQDQQNAAVTCNYAFTYKDAIVQMNELGGRLGLGQFLPVQVRSYTTNFLLWRMVLDIVPIIPVVQVQP